VTWNITATNYMTYKC